MPALSGVLAEATASGQLPLAHLSVLLVHHFSAEILGTIAALRKLGCRDVAVVFVGCRFSFITALITFQHGTFSLAVPILLQTGQW